MCGIIGAVGPRPVLPVLLDGLRKLEYRGYDSAGFALVTEGRIQSVRAVGNVAALRAAIREQGLGTLLGGGEAGPATGIGHTRWATHGEPSVRNAHPHSDTSGRISIVMNGIVDNYAELKARLIAAGAVFTSETDAEVIAHLVAARYRGDLVDAVRAAYQELHGSFALVVMSADHPGLLVGARRECPLVVGRGDGEQFIASMILAFMDRTRLVQQVEEDEIVVLRPEGVEFLTLAGVRRERAIEETEWDAETAGTGGYDTYMLKEIHEQPDAVRQTLGERLVRANGVDLGDLGMITDELLRAVTRVVIVACGTSLHAGLIARFAIEAWAGIPVEVEVASEYRYRNPIVGAGDLVIAITQSGETADTLAAMRIARAEGAVVLAVTNIVGSQATREADGVFYTRAGMEIGVAATKTFIAQVVAMYLIALRLAELHQTLEAEELEQATAELHRIPSLIDESLARGTEDIARIASEHDRAEFFMFLGRLLDVPVAREGALKLKELAYVPADAYPAGEMKHGPIALITKGTPVVAVAMDPDARGTVIHGMHEVRARGARVIAIARDDDQTIATQADAVIRVPTVARMLTPLVAVIPLQLLAYEIARSRGLDVDRPRNLAKTVTVE